MDIVLNNCKFPKHNSELGESNNFSVPKCESEVSPGNTDKTRTYSSRSKRPVDKFHKVLQFQVKSTLKLAKKKY